MYIPHSKQDIEKLKKELKINSVEELFSILTGEEKFWNPVDLGKHYSQQELIQFFEQEAIPDYSVLVGAGAYDHFIPPIVDSLIRSEFLTSYTPYQAEISQGTLKAIWDFQSLICEIFDQEVCNSSHYDGATASAEAVLMAKRIYSKTNPKANKYIIANSVNPIYSSVIKTYTQNINIHHSFVNFNKDGKIDLEDLQTKIDESVFAVIVQNPNFFGVIESDIKQIKKIIGDRILILIVSNPFLYFLVHPPEVDIVAANLQPFGIPLSFGGPYLGVIATSMKNIREMPGRIIGQTIDKNGKTAYTMILQTREQHIRREKATSNICTNQGLMAIRNTIYLLSMGKNNLIKVAQKNYTNIRYLLQKLHNIALPIFEDVFNEALIFVPNYQKIYDQMKNDHKVLFGVSLNRFHAIDHIINNFKKIGINYDISNLALICTTEKYSKNKLDQFVNHIKNISLVSNNL